MILRSPYAADNAAVARKADCLLIFGLTWSTIGKRLAERAQRVAARRGVAALPIDVEASPELARRHRVMAVPLLLLLRDGREIDRRLGEVGERDLDDWLAQALEEGRA
ncbi:MAG TPA: thioredoxin family protein [Stellaceae bacterium]|nr:thioredoxin family protein [Stellaceae bacterium]